MNTHNKHFFEYFTFKFIMAGAAILIIFIAFALSEYEKQKTQGVRDLCYQAGGQSITTENISLA